MAIHVLDLEGGTASLEFDAAEWPHVQRLIAKRFGTIAHVGESVFHDLLAFGSETFIYYHEWDPCLISKTPKGTAMLCDLAILADLTDPSIPGS